MVLRVVRAEPLPGYRLRVEFNDGVVREVDLSGQLWREMLEPLRDPEFFRQVRVDEESRSVIWPNGLDLDPEVLHGDAEPARPTRTPEWVPG
ncbi:MAG TPA: DUF2442 domain-containing protein [Candidatus Dormibacteraeota bacterium]|nr:DUF2442 domain-containing protein [Candidatus Dormibacteraeota bacterium]